MYTIFLSRLQHVYSSRFFFIFIIIYISFQLELQLVFFFSTIFIQLITLCHLGKSLRSIDDLRHVLVINAMAHKLRQELHPYDDLYRESFPIRPTVSLNSSPNFLFILFISKIVWKIIAMSREVTVKYQLFLSTNSLFFFFSF